MSRYDRRYWTGEPRTSEGVTHAVGVDIDNDLVAACGRMCMTMSDYEVPDTQTVTCLSCWYRRCTLPYLVKW